MDDEQLLRLVADALDERPPERLLRAAYESRSWADFDTELAELIEDSAGLQLAGTRSDANRHLVFESPVGVVDIDYDVDQRELVGRIDPPSIVWIERPDGSAEPLTGGKDVASFSASGIAAGSIRLRIETAGRLWCTAWFTI